MITVKVKPDVGEEYEVTAASRDVVVWEKTGKGRSFQSLMDDMKFSSLYELAHIAAKRQGLTTATLSDFETSVDIDLSEDEDEEPDPTQPDH